MKQVANTVCALILWLMVFARLLIESWILARRHHYIITIPGGFPWGCELYLELGRGAGPVWQWGDGWYCDGTEGSCHRCGDTRHPGGRLPVLCTGITCLDIHRWLLRSVWPWFTHIKLTVSTSQSYDNAKNCNTISNKAFVIIILCKSSDYKKKVVMIKRDYLLHVQ